MHALLFSSWVDRNNPRIDDNDHTNYEVMFLEDSICHQGNEVERLILIPVQLYDDHKEVGPREHSTTTQANQHYFIYVTPKCNKLSLIWLELPSDEQENLKWPQINLGAGRFFWRSNQT